MATVTKAQTMGVQKALLICIAGGRHCDAEMSRQPALVRAIKTEMEDPNFRVRVEWLEIEDFLDRYGNASGGAASDKGKSKIKQKGGGKKPSEKAALAGSGSAVGEGKTSENATESVKANGNGKVKDLQHPTMSAEQGSISFKAGGEDKSTKAGTQGGTASGKGKGKDQQHAKMIAEQGSTAPKVKPCKYFVAGSCKSGASCPYSHSVAQAQGKDNAKACRYFAIGTCKSGSSCAFSHTAQLGEVLNGGEANCVKSKNKAGGGTGPNEAKQSKGVVVGQEKAKGERKETTNANKIMCRECGKSFKSVEAVIGKHWFCKGREPIWICVHCGKKFECDKDCEQHQKAVGHEGVARANDDKDPEWVCGQCQKSFPSMEACVQHQRSTGHGDAPACRTCGKSFLDQKALAQHQLSTGHSGVTWLLEEAPEAMKEAMAAMATIASSSDEDVGWDCGCGRTFSSPEARAQHQDATGHVVCCLVCQKTFREEYPGGLAQHQRATGHCGGRWIVAHSDLDSD
eukprot:TRINITY_DN37843_c0_g1_i1.p1 TRINITY_DN37843_c0_g1~~TRINITY_DN37843_c0_g1_i1.p1  ORF type:complete len:583 (-),score=89.57 TRINITY_DN37843_c0_g1_i1:108-1649(-)